MKADGGHGLGSQHGEKHGGSPGTCSLCLLGTGTPSAESRPWHSSLEYGHAFSSRTYSPASSMPARRPSRPRSTRCSASGTLSSASHRPPPPSRGTTRSRRIHRTRRRGSCS